MDLAVAGGRGAVGNHWLARLGAPEQALLAPHARPSWEEPGTVLVEDGDRHAAAVLPCDGAVASLGVTLPGGAHADVVLVGSETILAATAARCTFGRAVMRVAGPVLRIESARLRDAADASARLGDALDRAAECLLAELMASAACRARHPLPRRLARCLLAVRDRRPDGRIALTQGYLARLLGVQRTTVSVAAATLAHAGVIRYARGLIDVPDRDALARAACSCDAAVRMHYQRLLFA